MAAIVETLPNDPLFRDLLENFTANPDHVLFRDQSNGVNATCSQLLDDMLHMRQKIIQALPASMFDSQGRVIPERPFMLVLAPANYYYPVGAFGALCCGAAFAPISNFLTPEEASQILEITNASCILVAPNFTSQVAAIQDHQAVTGRSPVLSIPIIVNNGPSTSAPIPKVKINPEMVLDPLSPAALIFTSGSTGPPKGIVRPRQVFYVPTPSFRSHQVSLAFRGSHWGAMGMPMIWRLLKGVRVEAIGDGAHEKWERFRQGGVTQLNQLPREWADLMKYFKEDLMELSVAEREEYVKGMRDLEKPVVMGSVPWPPVVKFWHELLGRPLVNLYGSSEMGVMMETTQESDPTLERCIGKPIDGAQAKLSNGDHGEILVKTSTMFSHYLNDEAATLAAFDEEGFFRSGDVGHRVGDQYVFDGRATADYIKFYWLHVPIHELEARIIELPYISEVYIVPANLNNRPQIAALVRLTTSKPDVSMGLSKMREDLKDKLENYKLPTALRILEDGERVPETNSGKQNRTKIIEDYFPLSMEALPYGVEVWGGTVRDLTGPRREWEWGGL